MLTIEKRGNEIYVYSADRLRRLAWMVFNGILYEFRRETYTKFRGRWQWVFRNCESWIKDTLRASDYMDAADVPPAPETPDDIPAYFV